MKFYNLDELNQHFLEIRFFYNYTFDDTSSMKATHAHPCVEIMYCASDNFMLFVEDINTHKSETVKISKNQFVILAPGVFHKFYITPNSMPKIINVEFEIFPNPTDAPIKYNIKADEIFSINTTLANLKNTLKDFLVINDVSNVYDDMEKLTNECNKHNDSYEVRLYIKLMVLKLFIDISRCLNSDSNNKIGPIYVSNAMKYIYTHFKEKISVEDVCKECGVSQSYLQRLFKEAFNCNILQKITNERFILACHLLRSTNMTNEEIVSFSGLPNRQALINLVKKAYNMTPQEYREQGKNYNFVGTSLTHSENVLSDGTSVPFNVDRNIFNAKK